MYTMLLAIPNMETSRTECSSSPDRQQIKTPQLDHGSSWDPSEA
jgi:hypothetical protein